MKAWGLFILMMSSLAFAGDKGNGGYSIVCRDSNNKITTAELLDIYEGRILYKRNYAVDLNSVEDLISLAKSRLGEFAYFTDKLEKEINGSDGRPRFNKRAVMAYASATQKGSLLDAYEEMFDSELKPWKDQQISAQRKSSLKTINSDGKKEPSNPKVTSDNFSKALSEALDGSGE